MKRFIDAAAGKCVKPKYGEDIRQAGKVMMSWMASVVTARNSEKGIMGMARLLVGLHILVMALSRKSGM